MKYPFYVYLIQKDDELFWNAENKTLKLEAQGSTSSEAVQNLEQLERDWLNNAVVAGEKIPEVPCWIRSESASCSSALSQYAESHSMNEADKAQYFSKEVEDERFDAIDERIKELENGGLIEYPLYYSGFKTTIRFDSDNNKYHGRIEDIECLVCFESETSEGIESAFRSAVDEYLVFRNNMLREWEEKRSTSNSLTLFYKGFYATIYYEVEIHSYIGKIQNMDDSNEARVFTTNFIGKTITSAESCFHSIVDEYINYEQ